MIFSRVGEDAIHVRGNHVHAARRFGAIADFIDVAVPRHVESPLPSHEGSGYGRFPCSELPD